METTAEKVRALRQQNPSMPTHLIAEKVGRSRERIRQLLVKLGLPTDLRQRVWDICPVCGGKKRREAKLCWKCYKESCWVKVPCYRCGMLIEIGKGALKTRRKRYSRTFCSYKCRALWEWESGQLKRKKAPLVTLECFSCHKVFQRSQRVVKGRIKQGCRHAFCDRECFLTYHKKEDKMEEQKELKFPLEWPCTHCGSTEFVADRAVKEEIARGKMGKDIRGVMEQKISPMVDPRVTLLTVTVLVQDWDYCLKCGTYQCHRIEKGVATASPGRSPGTAPFQRPPMAPPSKN